MRRPAQPPSDWLRLSAAEQLDGELTAFVTYDRRLAEVAHNAGFPVEMPGLSGQMGN